MCPHHYLGEGRGGAARPVAEVPLVRALPGLLPGLLDEPQIIEDSQLRSSTRRRCGGSSSSLLLMLDEDDDLSSSSRPLL